MLYYLLLFAILASASAFYFFRIIKTPRNHYQQELLKDREGKNHFMKTSRQSPFVESPEKFKPLNYFTPDLKYRISATLALIPDPKPVLLASSTGEDAQFYEYAFAEFDLNRVKNRLIIFKAQGEQTLFLSFKDLTNSKQTYGAGRYLDIEPTKENFIILDFNKAYNPYCAYNDNYSCPFPPKENYLKIGVEAGEKKYY